MKGWIGTLLAAVAVVIALTIKADTIFTNPTYDMHISLMTGLLSLSCVAFLLGQQTSELDFSRHVAKWTAGLAVLAILATNLDLLGQAEEINARATKVPAAVEPVAEQKTASKPRKPVAEIYEPDTPKLERIEKKFLRTKIDPLATEVEEGPKYINRVYKSESELPESGEPTEQEKQAFKKLLESQGLKYDPDTAFRYPDDDEADFSSKR